MKNLFIFVPLALFFITYQLSDIYMGTIVLMASTTLLLIVERLRTGTVSKMHLYVTVLLLVLGTITVLVRDPKFIQWKLTIIHWVFALILFASQWRGKTPTVQALMEMAIAEQSQDEDEEPFELSDGQWKGLNTAWAVYFLAIGFLNLFIAYSYSEDIWVKFKVFGILGLQVVFMAITFTWLFRAMKPAPDASDE